LKAKTTRRLGAGSLLAAASLGVVLYVFVLDLERTSPGPLSAPHARDGRLDGGRSCDACHGERGAAMAEACGECHAQVAASLDGAPGFHAALADADPRDCGLCHREHLGAGLALVDELGFQRAGFASRDEYDHRGLAFVPAGKHADLACRECHANADAALLPAGQQRFGGLEASCGSCHDDPHDGRMVQACADCHAQTRPFDDFSEFEHQDGFALAGSHAGLACTACHARDGAHAVEVLAGSGPRPPARACLDCHESPHDRGFLARAARLAGDAAARADGGATCASCHDATHGSFTGAAVGCPQALHAATGFALDAPHDRAECADCHAPSAAPVSTGDGGAAPFAARFPGRDARACGACHLDPHGGQFDGDAFAAEGCSSCHAPHGFTPATFDAQRHGLTAFALTGAHARADCAGCHPRPDGSAAPAAPRAFADAPRECSACHADAHAGTRAGATWSGLLQDARGGTDCAACHTTAAFGDVRAFDHARWTGLALEGAHARADCVACHAPRAEPDAAGRTFGRADERFGLVERCGSCHADPHADAAWQAESPVPDCSACHTVETFAGEEARRFDHARWTGFALSGRHVDAACASCHGQRSIGSGAGRAETIGVSRVDVQRERRLGRVAARFPGSPESCATCHADPHAGTFARLPRPPAGPPYDAEAALTGRAQPAASAGDGADCARCHTTLGFGLPAVVLDHAWTGYALAGPHARVACAGCHAPHPPDPETGRRFAPAAGTRCADCHADPHAGQFGARTDCARCHAGAAELAFDHDDSRFPLDAQHARLACTACHQPWALPPERGGGVAVRYRPLGITCKDCHGTAQDGR
jgi:hypothetical protein